jgi:UDP-N-acetylmuramate dehydrogenase
VPSDEDDLKALLAFAAEQSLPYLVIGNGTKLLVRDSGFPGMMIKLGQAFTQIAQEEDRLRAGAGADLSGVIQYAADQGLSGLENLAGIPGTLGGGIVRNVSAYDAWLTRHVRWVRALDRDREYVLLPQEKLRFSYRSSVFLERRDLVVVEAELSLQPGDREEILSRMRQATTRKLESQPLSWPSAGCIFKNPDSRSAGSLIEQSGCLGLAVGGARVSPRHGNFVINTGTATAADILRLMEEVQTRVRDKFGVTLEPELEIV